MKALERTRFSHVTIVIKTENDEDLEPLFKAAKNKELFCGGTIAALGWGDYMLELDQQQKEAKYLKSVISGCHRCSIVTT